MVALSICNSRNEKYLRLTDDWVLSARVDRPTLLIDGRVLLRELLNDLATDLRLARLYILAIVWLGRQMRLTIAHHGLVKGR